MTRRENTMGLVIAALGLALAACEAPRAGLRLALSEGPSQTCPSTDCGGIPMTCKTYLSIRVIDPDVPETPHLSQCVEVPSNSKRDLCSIGSIDVDSRELPLRDLEVQVALYPEHMITFDPMTGSPVCPADIRYDAANGFPIEAAVTPALGGRSFYRPGDETVWVTLGCTNLEAIHNEACLGTASVHVAATVDDFNTRISVDGPDGNRLSLAVGEPRPQDFRYLLNPGDVKPLARVIAQPPAWAADVDQLFSSSACLAVLDDTPQSTTTLTCIDAKVTDEEIDFTSTPGIRLTKPALDEILAALSIAQFPTEGLTIGIVLDVNGKPIGNRVVTMPNASTPLPTIKYLSADRTTSTGTSTAPGERGGIFVSTDAPFGTVFSTTGGTPPKTIEARGGRVAGKVSIVVLKFREPIVGG